jgi:hypothetical protein
MLTRPKTNEYAEPYAKYISQVPDGPLLDFLSRQLGDYRELFSGVTDDAASVRPEPNKWSAKEVLGHVCDAERIMSYRALRFARGDAQELAGFEQDDYVREAYSNTRPLPHLISELESVRRASIALLGSLPEEAAVRSGVASKNPVSVRALAYIIAGHAEHHLVQLRARSRELTTRGTGSAS